MNRDVRTIARSAGTAVLPLAIMILGVWLFWSTNWVLSNNAPVTADVYANGAIQGLLIALIALGFVLVYRANRIVNFAAADLGGVPASLAFLLFASVGWNIYLSALVGLGSAIVLGILVEFLFLRIFFNATRLIVTVVTIAVTQLLVAFGFFLPQWLGSPNTDSYPPFINVTFTIGHTPFNGSDVMVLVVVPLVLIALATFFRYSSVGVALRASAENADRASLLGIPVRRLQSVVWGLAAVLAYVALFLRIGVVGQNLGRVLDEDVLLTALGAAVIGRMERMPTAVLAAVGLEIVDQAAVFHFESSVYSVGIRALIIAIALLLQRGDAVSRLASSATSTWQATREIKRVPAELRSERPVVLTYVGLGAVALVGLALIPLLLSVDRVKLVGTIGIYAIIGLSLVVLTGWAGQVSLGQMGFVGLAGAVAGTLSNRWHWDIGLILLAAGATGATATVVVGIPTLRARGLAFAVVTLAFSLATSFYLLNTGYSPMKSWVPDGPIARTHVLGLFGVSSETSFYVLVLVVLVLSLVMVRSLRSSRIGRVLIAVRDNERAAQAFSVGSRGALVVAFAISGFLAGMAGALFVLQQRALDGANFDPTAGLQVFSMVVVGGLGSIGGVILGAVYVKGIQYFLTQPEWSFLSSGAGLLLVLLLMPDGLGGAVGRGRDGLLRWYAKRRGIRVPSLVADTRLEAAIPDVDMADALIEAAAHADDLVEVRE